MGTVDSIFESGRYGLSIFAVGSWVLASWRSTSWGRPMVVLSCKKINKKLSSELVSSDAHLSGALSLDRDPPSGLASDFHDYFY